jgi:3-hydroxyisobutyrate dehydrogenase-like beta-hydroxyacid dehydrogenase
MTDGIVAKPQLGFIGLGNMGARIARRLLDAGYPLGVHSRTVEKARPLVDLGARVYSSAMDLALHADVVLTMLPDDAAVQEVVIGPAGVLGGLRAGGTIIDLSSVHPSTSRDISAAALRGRVSVLDAPVSGSTPQAETGGLVVFVGGDPDVYETCRPILEVIGNASFLMGPSGAGSTMKLVVNDLLGVEMQALAEALTLGQRAGLDKDLLIDVLQQTSVLTAGQKAKLQNVRTDEYPAQFALRLMWKDFGNVLRLAQEYQVPVPATAAAHQISTIDAARGVEEDFSAVIRTMAQLAGLPTAAHDCQQSSHAASQRSRLQTS